MPTISRLFGIRYYGSKSTAGLLAALDAFAAPPRVLVPFETQEKQQPTYNSLSIFDAFGKSGRRSQLPMRLLNWQQLLPTPSYVRKQLSLQKVALWQLANGLAWAVSTEKFTVLLSKEVPPLIDLVTFRPAKGGDEMRLYAGSLILYDAYHSKALALLAAAIGEKTKITVKQSESYDC